MASILPALSLVLVAAPQQEDFDAAAFFGTYCTKCHGAAVAKAGVTLHDMGNGPRVGEDVERWELVLEMLRERQMPPRESDQPSEAERETLAAWIDAELDAFVASEAKSVVPVARRLTNREYERTMGELLGVDLDLASHLPEDPTRPYRFTNTAEYLLLGLEQLDRYEENARRALASAIVGPEPPQVHTKRQDWSARTQRGMPDPTAMQRDEIGVFGNRNRTVVNGMQVFDYPERGAFRIRVKASAILPEGYSEVPLGILLGHDIVGVGVSALSPAEVVGTLRLTRTVDDPEVFELTGRIENFPLKPEHRYRRGGRIDGRLVITPPHYTVTPVNFFDDGTLNDKPDPLSLPRAVVEWMEFEAPYFEAWPPAHHTRILFESPLREEDPRAYVAEVLRRFLPRAFRRPVEEAEVERFVRIYDILCRELELESFEEAVRETLALVLVTPDFLYHTRDAGHPHHEVAARLSYFLWGTLPDPELRALADAGELQDPEVVAREARRMLADTRAEEFLDSFVSQWLFLERLGSVPIDIERFPRFLHTIDRGERRGQEVPNRPTVRDAMYAETVAFVGELVRRNASVLELVDSNFVMLNRRLAAHYGVEGVDGHELRPVELPEGSPLGGLMTQGSVLVATSTGATPHTVYRAVWLREAILGDEVPAPPADVPALEDSAGAEAAAEAVTLKDLLALHRTQESCRDCHARLDPWGIPLEEFDATGRFHRSVPPMGARVPRFDRARFKDLAEYEAHVESLATVEVEADAEVPGGPLVDGVEELKAYLLAHRNEDVVRNVTRRLLSYALGRELTVHDRGVVEDLVQASLASGYGLRDLIVGVCTSDPFLGSDRQ